MFISRPETIWLDKGMLQAFVEDHQAHPIQTIPPFSFCNIPGIVLSGSAAESQIFLLLPSKSSRTAVRKLACSSKYYLSDTYSPCEAKAEAKQINIRSSEPQVVETIEMVVCNCQAFRVHK